MATVSLRSFTEAIGYGTRMVGRSMRGFFEIVGVSERQKPKNARKRKKQMGACLNNPEKELVDGPIIGRKTKITITTRKTVGWATAKQFLALKLLNWGTRMVRLVLGTYKYGRKPEADIYTVTLDKYECAMIEMVVADRTEVEDPMMELQTLGAEMAFAKLFNCYMAWDRKYAFYDHFLTLWIEGECVKKTVDVKYTGHQGGMLCVDLETPRRGVCDLYVLMTGLFPTFTFRGCIPGKLFIVEENKRKVWGQKQYAVRQNRLSLEFFSEDAGPIP